MTDLFIMENIDNFGWSLKVLTHYQGFFGLNIPSAWGHQTDSSNIFDDGFCFTVALLGRRPVRKKKVCPNIPFTI